MPLAGGRVCSRFEFDHLSVHDIAMLHFAVLASGTVDSRVTNLGVNLLGIESLDHDIQALLAKGLGFVPTPPRQTLVSWHKDFVAGLDRLLRSLRLRDYFGAQPYSFSRFRQPNPRWEPSNGNPLLEAALQQVRREALARAANARERLAATYPAGNLSRSDREALRKLKGMDVVVRNADKNLGVTIMSAAWYDNEVDRQVGNATAYRPVSSVPVEDIKAKFLALVRKGTPAHAAGKYYDMALAIDPYLPSFLQQRVWPARRGQYEVPRFYIIPKLHKRPPVGRPIVSSHSWVTTPASQVVDFLLQPLVFQTVPGVLKDTGHAIRLLESAPTPNVTALFTADVESLYTSINLDHALQAIRFWLKRAFDSGAVRRFPWWNQRLSVFAPEQVIGFVLDLVKFVVYNNYFMVSPKRLFLQLVGLAMGTPCAVVVANLHVAWVEVTFWHVPSRMPQPLALWARFIDDILGLWTGTMSQLEEYKAFVAKAYPGLTLTWDVSPSVAEFLDLQISKGRRYAASNVLDLAVHRKRLNRYLYLQFRSAHPLAQKRAFIKGELIRFVRNSSHFDAFLRDVKLFVAALRARGYPRRFLRTSFAQVSYNDRQLYLTARSREQHSGHGKDEAAYAMVTTFTPFTQEVNVRDILTLTRTGMSSFATRFDPTLLRNIRPGDHRWIVAYKLPPRLHQLIGKTWPTAFST
jgi:hypothetical protein